jgi:pimeloyl-ACP methyl ester carboxylesterase
LIRRPFFLFTVLACSLSAIAKAPHDLTIEPKLLPPTTNVQVFGQKIVYYDVGKGPALVLVHGFGSQAAVDWGQVILPLSRTHRVIALDQIGFGQSDKPYIDYDIQTFVDFLGEFLRTIRVQHFTLAGESLGGWVAAAYTIQSLAPENKGEYAVPAPDKLVLEDAAGHKAIHVDGPVPLLSSLQDGASIASIFYDKSLVTEAVIRQNFAIKLKANDGTTQRLLRANTKLASETVGDKVARITIPTLIIWGGNDPIVPLDDGKDYAAKIPGAKLIIIPECGHAASIERPQQFLDAIEPFLR